MRRFLVLILCFSLPLSAQEVLRGEVKIELEQMRGFISEETRLLSFEEARNAALEDAAVFFGAMIYGWSFHYEVGERARSIEERLDLTSLGTIIADDPRLEAEEPQLRDFILYLWSDYRLSDTQRHRLAKWRAGGVRTAQAYGYSSLENKHAALEDAARTALRAILRGMERNRPKEVSGYISLAAFPRYGLNSGRWMAAGRFRIEIVEIVPFSAY